MPKMKRKPLRWERVDTRPNAEEWSEDTDNFDILYEWTGDYWSVMHWAGTSTRVEIWRALTLDDAKKIAQFLHERSQIYQ